MPVFSLYSASSNKKKGVSGKCWVLRGSRCYSEKIENVVEVGNKTLRYFYLAVLKRKCRALAAVKNSQQCVASVQYKDTTKEGVW